MYSPVSIVEVRIWGKAVGAVALDPKLEYYAFEYQPAFLRSGIDLAPLTMPIDAASEPFVFPDLPDLTYRRLPGMLADALPDDFGNALIDAWMAREGVIERFLTQLPVRFQVASGPAQINGVLIDVAGDGRAQSIERIALIDGS